MSQQEKKDVTVKVRITPTQALAFENAAKGNVSKFIREAANEKLRRICGHKVSFAISHRPAV